MHNFIEQLKTHASKFAEEQGLVLYEVTFRPEKDGRVLRISLDGNVTLDKCAAISSAISEWIDALPENAVPYEKYHLEVTSLGLDRPLKTETDFKNRISKLCKIQTKTKDETGRRRYKGRIETVDSESVTIYTEEESVYFTIKLNNIQKAQLEVEL